MKTRNESGHQIELLQVEENIDSFYELGTTGREGPGKQRLAEYLLQALLSMHNRRPKMAKMNSWLP